jgi:hypothetical protein
VDGKMSHKIYWCDIMSHDILMWYVDTKMSHDIGVICGY